MTCSLVWFFNEVSCFKSQMSAKEGGNLPGMARRSLSPNHDNFKNCGALKMQERSSSSLVQNMQRTNPSASTGGSPAGAVLALCCSYGHARQGPLAAAAGAGRGRDPARPAGAGPGALAAGRGRSAARLAPQRGGGSGGSDTAERRQRFPGHSGAGGHSPAPGGTPCTGCALPSGREAGKAGTFDRIAELQPSEVPKPNAQKLPQQPRQRLPRSAGGREAGSFTPQSLNSRIPVSLAQSVHLLHHVRLPGQPLKTRALKQSPPSSPRFPGCQILKIQ